MPENPWADSREPEDRALKAVSWSLNASPPMTEDRANPPDKGDLRVLLHSLNNQLGIILAHAELLETKLVDDGARARATQIVSATLDAMTVARSIRDRVEADDLP